MNFLDARHVAGMCGHMTKPVYSSSPEQARMQFAFAQISKFWKTPTITYRFLDEPIEWTRAEKSFVQDCMDMWTGTGADLSFLLTRESFFLFLFFCSCFFGIVMVCVKAQERSPCLGLSLWKRTMMTLRTLM